MDVRMPDGTIIKNVPEGTTRAQLQEKLNRVNGTMAGGQPPMAINPVAQTQGSAPRGLSDLVSGKKPDAPGIVETLLRNFNNGATFNLMPKIAAAGDAALPSIMGSVEPYRVSKAPTFSERYNQNLAFQRGQDSAANSANPITSIVGGIAGGIANPVARALPVAQTIRGNVLQGAGLGAAYGVGASDGSLGDKVVEGLKGGAFGAATGLVTGGIQKVIRGASQTPEAQDLVNRGVNLTTGQRLGGSAQRIEEGATSIPVLGDMIKSRQLDATVGFNRAAYDEVLAPLGQKYPAAAPTGNEAIQKIGEVIGGAYDAAFTGAKAPLDRAMQADIQTVASEAALNMPTTRVDMLKNAVQEKILSRLNGAGELDGQELQAAKEWFSQQARKLASAADPEQRALGEAYGGILDSLKNSIARNDPNRGAMLNAADAAYARFVRVAAAASPNNASAKGGIFSANQLGQAARAADNSVRKMNFAKGNALMQDLAQAGQKVLTQTVPDSGTPFRSLTSVGIGGLLGNAFSPQGTAIALSGLGTGTAAYTRPGQNFVNALLFGAPQTRSAIAQYASYPLPGLLGMLGTQASTK